MPKRSHNYEGAITITTRTPGISSKANGGKASKSTPKTGFGPVISNKNKNNSNNSNNAERIRPYDILCGRGKESFNNIGNLRFRITVSLYLNQYIAAKSRSDKSTLIVSIVRYLRSPEVGVRFLKQVKVNSLGQSHPGETYYVELCERECREKVGHALRDLTVTVHQTTIAQLEEARRQQDEEIKQKLGTTTTTNTTASPTTNTPTAPTAPTTPTVGIIKNSNSKSHSSTDKKRKMVSFQQQQLPTPKVVQQELRQMQEQHFQKEPKKTNNNMEQGANTNNGVINNSISYLMTTGVSPSRTAARRVTPPPRRQGPPKKRKITIQEEEEESEILPPKEVVSSSVLNKDEDDEEGNDHDHEYGDSDDSDSRSGSDEDDEQDQEEYITTSKLSSRSKQAQFDDAYEKPVCYSKPDPDEDDDPELYEETLNLFLATYGNRREIAY